MSAGRTRRGVQATPAWKSVCGQTPPIPREAAAAGASAAAGRPGPQRRRIPTLTATRFPLSLLRLLSSPFYVRPEWLLCNTDESVEVYGGGVGEDLLRQLLEAFQQTLRRAAVFGSQRHHEEVEVVEQGHVIVAVRLCHMEQLSPAVFDAHAWHG